MDRISLLYDELLRHVLSFLTTKEAALTSVLSKRWRDLFALVPNLDIDDSVFLHPEEGKRDSERILHSFVDRVLALQGDSPIDKFSLKCKTGGIDEDHANRWICNVLHRGVSEMNLFVDLGYMYELPLEIFMSKTLVKLSIGCGFPFQLNRAQIFLPVLKTLVLDLVWIYNGQLQILLSACPVLEELVMTNVHLSYGYETLSSTSLKSLTIDCDNLLCAFSFDTPNLVCLKHTESVAWDYPIVNFEKLVEAHIHIILFGDLQEQLISRNDDCLEDDVFLKLGNVQKLVHGIRNVQKLYLSPFAFQVLALCCQTMPMFNNLTFLDIDSTRDVAWQAMPVLLRNFPQLETLVIKRLLHCVTDKCGDVCICIPREDKGRSLLSCPVKRLEIREFDGITRDLEMIKHFLDYLPCLKEMDIYIREGSPRFTAPLIPELNADMLMRYNDLSGRSPNVKIKVHGSLPWASQ